MSKPTQSFENHARFVVGYHVVTTALLLLPTLYFGYRAATAFSLESLALAVFAVGVLLVGFWARFFALRVQDRLIRQEERLRMERLLTGDLRGRIGEFTVDQLVALRFASDDELADLARRVLAEGLEDRATIKRAVRSWRADHERV